MNERELKNICNIYSNREGELTPAEALTMLTQAYMAQCGISVTYRTLVEGASWYWQKLLGKSDHELAKIARKKTFTGLMPYLSEEFNERKEHYWEYDICNLDSKDAVEAATSFLEDYEDERFRIAFCRGFIHYVEKLRNYEAERDEILRENPYLAVTEYLDLDQLTTGHIKNILSNTEKTIKTIVGDDVSTVYIDSLDKSEKINLERQLLKRSVLLNKLFTGTDNELLRLRQVNYHLIKLSDDVHRRVDALKQSYVADDSFDDDTFIEGYLSFHYTDADSVLTLEDDDYYGSDFGLMCKVLDAFYSAKEPFGNIGSIIRPGTETNRPKAKNNYPFNNDRYGNIAIGNSLYDLCHYKSFSVPDVIRLNNFYAEAILKALNITTQNGDRSACY